METYRGSKDIRCISYFEKAIRSIEEQTDSDWIIILVDDCSPDPEVIRHENVIGKKLGDRIHILRSDVHVGAAEARNIGVRKAHELGCPFILFMDADDMSHPKRLENARGFMDALKIATKYRDFSPEEYNTTVTSLYLKILDYTSLS